MKKRGFTMVEVIIVVAIIAILASIIVPKMSGSRDSAKLKACHQNIRLIKLAMEMYANDNGSYFPPSNPSYSCAYLVPNYLKAAPVCPTGHPYLIAINSPTAGNAMVYAAGFSGSPPVNPHPGLPDCKPSSYLNSSRIYDY